MSVIGGILYPDGSHYIADFVDDQEGFASIPFASLIEEVGRPVIEMAKAANLDALDDGESLIVRVTRIS